MTKGFLAHLQFRSIHSILGITWTLLFVTSSGIAQNSWSLDLWGVGTFSSPRCIDLNLDGVMDVVFGAGREEFQSCDSAIIAVDGKNGEILWHAAAADQIFGSPIFNRINEDDIPDIIIGGRSAELFALDGNDGSLLWDFKSANEIKKPVKQGWYNFYNPQRIPDQNGDGIQDILVSNGGDVMAAPHDPDRPAGHLVILDGRHGKVLAKAKMPDDKEIYMSILVIQESDDPLIVFGTGGETIAGNLWVCYLSEVLKEDLSGSTRLDSSESKGYIGPPAGVDINLDGFKDIVASAVDGRLMAFDGLTKHKIWEVHIPNTESYGSVAIGYFDEDKIPDFFVSYGRGVWPQMGWSIQKAVSGKDGSVFFTDSLGFYQMTTALALDVDGDGRDEILMSLNFQEVNEIFQKFFYTMLVTINFKTGAIDLIGDTYEGSNLSSTPWIGDLDHDGKVDIVHCHGSNLKHTYTFDGFRIHRISTDIPVHNSIKWGAYQGSNYDGVFK